MRTLIDYTPGRSLPAADLLALIAEAMSRGKPCRFRARASGWCMAPFLKNDDVLTIAPLPPGGASFGDVVAIRWPGTDRLVIHRVVSCAHSSTVRTKGDNLAAADEPVRSALLLGRITRVERNGRRVAAGLGPERILLALASRGGVLHRLRFAASRLYRASVPRRPLP